MSHRKTSLSRSVNTLVQVLALGLVGPLAGFSTASLAQTMSDYAAMPPLAERIGETQVMLTMSLDHQLFMKAYNDYDDLTGDGEADTTYNKTFDYAGYFDHLKCYTYAAGRFQYSSMAGGEFQQACADDEWSGNFLNWLTMTRMDLVRFALYGGYRSTDADGTTVLERAYLPPDSHSFAKYYDGADIAELVDVTSMPTACEEDGNGVCTGYTFCNTTQPPPFEGPLFSHEPAAQNLPPQLRVARGNYSFWASSERFQCLYGPTARTSNSSTWSELPFIGDLGHLPESERESQFPGHNGNDAATTGIPAFNVPPTKAQGRDFTVRVEVCGANEQPGAHNCKRYSGTSSKPIGVLQSFGEDRDVQFGLMTGGLGSNTDWGVLRKNIGSVAAEINPDTGVFSQEGVALIRSLDAMRIVDYQYYHPSSLDRRGTYNESCHWGRNSIDDAGACRNWGNPFSEILAESYRYFSGAENAMVSAAADGNLLGHAGLGVDTWTDPLGEGLACANMNVIGFNSSSVSYDSDLAAKLGDLPFLPGAETPTGLLADISQTELSNGRRYFVGSVAGGGEGSNNGFCTPKAIADLSTVSGVCPEAPNLLGSFLGAGLAQYVFQNNVRGAGTASEHTIRTIGVTMAGNLPRISIPIGDGSRKVEIVPVCFNAMTQSSCALVSFRPLEVDPANGSGRYLVDWEDSQQGGDFDIDMNGIIEYEFTASGALSVTTQALYVSTRDAMGFGFGLSGTGNADADTLHFLSGINDFNWNGVNLGREPQSRTFTIAGSSETSLAGEFLDSPLYYAAKYGSESVDESYSSVTNPTLLGEQLDRVLNRLLERNATGSAGVTFSPQNLTGEGLAIQSLYLPRLDQTEEGRTVRSIKWAGVVNGLFIDRRGNYREDTNANGRLDPADNLIVPRYDEASDTTVFDRYAVTAAGTQGALIAADLPVYQINPVWSAHQQLSLLPSDEASEQRQVYNSNSPQRYIFTANAGTGNVVTGAADFVASAAAAPAWQNLLDAGDLPAADLINFIRGEEVEGLRSRSIQLGDDAQTTRWLLGDIVHSTPAVVGRPNANFYSTYADETYQVFQEQYRNRRHVVYVGANDGMLHAFNAGFFNPDTQTYQRTATGGPGGIELGNELWGYVPHNLLPHLKWLAMPDYSHVYYVDSKIQTFDAKIFPPSARHPGGWGTILVTGMRFGGGDYLLDDDTFRSAYVIMDITDPEAPPTLIGEFSHPALGFTTSNAQVVKFRQRTATGTYARDEWFLVVGSGPQGLSALNSGSSERDASLFYLDLNTIREGGTPQLQQIEVDAPASYVGNIAVVDWQWDMQDDAIYFGTVDANGGGGLWQVVLNPLAAGGNKFGTPTRLLTGELANKPFFAPPLPVADSHNNYWVFAGTGRFLVGSDLSAGGQHSYFGVKVGDRSTWPASGPVENISLNAGDLLNVSDYQVLVDQLGGGVYVSAGDYAVEPQTMEEVDREVLQQNGWYRNFAPNQSNFTRSVLTNSTLYVNAYSPTDGSCSAAGGTTAYIMDIFNGLPQVRREALIFGDDGIIVAGVDAPLTAVGLTVGLGSSIPTDATVLPGSVETPMGDGSKPTPLEPQLKPPPMSRRSWREVPLDEVVR